MNRKSFLQKSLTAAALLGTGGFPFEAFAAGELIKLSILHTNDQHSRIDPFPMDGGKYQGCGGFAKRAAVIEQIRAREKNVLLLDSGDIFQGTPYFNKYKGELEINLMNEMRYDACTIGNHDFDGGLENLSTRMAQAAFPFLITNFNFENTPCQGHTKPYHVFVFDGLRIGVFGVSIELEGLVPAPLFGNTRYTDPLAAAEKWSRHLKRNKECDLVICLSHLGYSYHDKKVSDKTLAASSAYIDLILGGHTHTFLDNPTIVKNRDGQPVLINQVGWAGICLGQLDFYFDRKKKRLHTKNNLVVVTS